MAKTRVEIDPQRYVDKAEQRIAELEAEVAALQTGVKQAFAALTDDQRAEIARDYCMSCWRPDPRCQCWNDE